MLFKMTKNKITIIVLGIILTIFLHGLIYATNITDLEGRNVILPSSKINRIIALGPGALRLVAYMNLTSKLCGVERIEFKLQKGIVRPYWFAVKNKIKSLPIIGEGGPGKLPYFEKVIMTRPDLIIAIGYTSSQADLIFEKTKVPVLILSYGSLGGINLKLEKSLKLLGKVFSIKKRAKTLIQYMHYLTSDLKSRTSILKSIKRVYVGGIAYKGIHDLTSSDTDFLPFKLLNVVNVAKFSPLKGHIFINWENLIMWNPDYIFIDKTSLPLVERNFKNNIKKFMLLNAFKNNRIYVTLPYNYYNTNIELTFVLSYFIGKILYPKAFNDVKISQKANEIFKKFLGCKIKFNLKEKPWNFHQNFGKNL